MPPAASVASISSELDLGPIVHMILVLLVLRNPVTMLHKLFEQPSGLSMTVSWQTDRHSNCSTRVYTPFSLSSFASTESTSMLGPLDPTPSATWSGSVPLPVLIGTCVVSREGVGSAFAVSVSAFCREVTLAAWADTDSDLLTFLHLCGSRAT